MDPAAAVRHFKAQHRALGAPERAVSEKAYMKSELQFHGVTAAQLRATCADFCKANELDARSLRAIVDALFATDWFDLRSMGIALLERKRRLLGPRDAPWLVELARAGACWAHVDYIATQVLDPLVAAHPELLAKTRAWAKDRDFWVRRTALLAQLRALRGGEGDFALFAELAAPMLEEREFFIRKAIGWILREVSKKRPVLVRDFLREHGERASGLTWREGTKYLPAAMRRELEAIPRAKPRNKAALRGASSLPATSRAPRKTGARRDRPAPARPRRGA
jgi:3-methyladenine DNA glycosylase AlkD